MEELLAFVARHPVLFGLLGVVSALIVANELYGTLRGGRRLSPTEAVRLSNDRDARFVDEEADELIVLAQVVEDPLDDQDLLETADAVAARAVDLGHTARGDFLEEVVLPEDFRLLRGHGADTNR